MLVECAPSSQIRPPAMNFRPTSYIQHPTSIRVGVYILLYIVAVRLFAPVLFRGFGFQILLQTWGPYTTIFTVGAVFGVLHGANPNSTWLALINTTGFGILFGYAFLRSGDLWLPIGLHFGWNFTLPLFGVNVSGLTMKLTGHEMQWSRGPLWSGGEHGPEGSGLIPPALLARSLFRAAQ